jgi:hypothetical protein
MPDIANRFTYTIDAHNNIAVHGDAVAPVLGFVQFTSHAELESVAAAWTSSRLLDIWNRFPDNTPVKKFTNHQTAIRRIWKAIEANATSPPAARSVQLPKSCKPGLLGSTRKRMRRHSPRSPRGR